MLAIPPKPTRARQLLPKECYFSPEWFAREQVELFGRTWTFACVQQDIPEIGDYLAVQVNQFPMVIVRTSNGSVAAYHNTCRHRGTEMLEGRGNCRHGIVCPYHAWTYNADDGSLRGMPKKALCFPDITLSDWPLHRCATGQLGDLIFVNPEESPEETFETWCADVGQTHMWPHDLSMLSEKRPVRYEINANWKVFCENAMDGYHLSYLHDKTLMGPDVEDQDWDAVGRHWVFMSKGRVESSHNLNYAAIPGVNPELPQAVLWQFFPNSGVLTTSVFFSVYTIVPVGPERCYLELRTWMMPRESQDPTAKRTKPSATSGHGFIMKDGKRCISLETLACHALDSLDFQIEDMWVCEQQQKAFHSPRMDFGQLADHGESALTWFQAHVMDHVPLPHPSPGSAGT